jgi:hypothetical protein
MLQAAGQGPLIQSNETDAFDGVQHESEEGVALEHLAVPVLMAH